MLKKKLRLTVAITTIILVFIVFALSIFLNTTSFRQNYVNSLISTYRISGRESVRNIEHAIKYGKDLNKFYGIEDILAEVQDVSAQIDNVRIVMPNGDIKYDLVGEVSDEKITQDLISQVDFTDKNTEDYESILYQDNYHLFIPIYEQDEWVGSLELSFAREFITNRVNNYLRILIRDSLLLALLAITILSYVIYKFSLLNQAGELRQKFIIIIILLLLGITQLTASFINYRIFNQGYLDLTRENAQTVAEIIKNDVNSIIAKGVSYDSLHGMEDWLEEIVDSIPEVDRVYLVDETNTIKRDTSSLEKGPTVEPEYLSSSLLAADLNGEIRIVNIQTSQTYINHQLREIILDMLTLMVVSFVFTVELTLFAIMFLKGKLEKDKKGSKKVDINANRNLGFLFFLASSMPLSFIPLVMNDLYRPVFALSKDVVLGLPLTIETVFAGLSISFIGSFIEKKGWKAIFMFNLLLFVVGNFLSGIAGGPLIFIASRALVGLGYGACLAAMMSLAVLMVKRSDEKNKSLAALTAGMFAGSNCGVVIGGMFADIIGFYQVFWLAAVLSILTALFALRFLPNLKEQRSKEAEIKESKVSLKEFFGDLTISAYFILLLIPATVAIAFLNYFFPLFARDLNLSASNISRAFLINGLMIVYLGPALTNFISKKISNRQASILASLIMASAFIIFFIRGDLMAAFLVVILLGIADGFGLVVRNNYLLNLKQAKDLGESRVLGYYNMARKIAQAIGPMVFATVLALGRQQGVGLIAFFLLIGVVIFKQATKNLEGSSLSN